jgi:inhibitor of cysteine peptidase
MKPHRLQKRFVNCSVPVLVQAGSESLEQRQLLAATGADDQITQTTVVNDDVSSGSHIQPEGQSAEQLQSQVDPALSEWRDNILNTLIQLADESYGEQFSQEAFIQPIWIIDPVIDIPRWLEDGADALSISFANTAETANAAVSDTNVQVEGVDEGDIVETDGEYIYTITNQRELVIVRAATDSADAMVLSRTDLASRPTAMFLHNGTLTVISQNSAHYLRDGISLWNPGRSQTIVSVLDVSNAALPTMLQETVVDGDFQSARAIGDQVYIVAGNNANIPYLPSLQSVNDQSSSTGQRYETRDDYVRRLNLIIHGDGGEREGIAPPSVYQRGTDNENLQRLGWLDGAQGLITPETGQLTSVLRFDTTSSTPGPVDNIGVYNRRFSDSTIYASQNAIYLVATEYERIENDGLFILPFSSQAFSRIHKIDISSGTMELRATGIVSGIVESQFSVDEHKGLLRIATTSGNTWDNSSLNHLFILEDAGGQLTEVGSVRNLAQGERIYSVNFDRDRAWMVTFRQVDPIFSFDLSDPTNPVVTGELKITGYSEYLQLIDEDHLLAIGRAATDDGRLEEVQISLFNVSDMANPTLVDRYSFDGSRWGHSSALYDHHAFNYLPEAGILAIPYGAPNATFPATGQSLTLLNINTSNGISLLGELPAQTDVNIQRSIQIGDLLHAISSTNIQTINLAEPETVLANVRLGDNNVPVDDREELLARLGQKLRNVIDVREYTGPLGVIERRVELREILGDLIPDEFDDVDFEFRVSNIDDGAQIVRESSTRPFLLLQQAGSGALPAGTYNFQVRTRSKLLDNPEWSTWTPGAAITIGSDIAQMLSDRQLTDDNRRINWSAVADRVSMVQPEGGGIAFKENAVDHYELWVSDAIRRETVEWIRDVPTTEFDVSNLPAGQFWAWFRPVFEDGTIGPWSRRETFETLGRKLGLGQLIEHTANRTPVFTWEELADATSFEVEVTTPDGSEVLYSATDLLTARLKFADELEAGTYSFRVRALLASGGTTEWTDPHTFTIVDRPIVSIANNTISWDNNGAQRHELWISRDNSAEPLFHNTDLTSTEIGDAIATLGLDDFGRFSVWVRSFMPDGSKTAWSPRAILQRFAEAVAVNPIANVPAGQAATISWAVAEGVESYEVYIQKAGQSGAAYRLAGITGLTHEVTAELSRGNYLAWVRGALPGGGFTKWGPSHAFAMSDELQVTVADNVVSWLSSNNSQDLQYEVWVNRVDSNLRLLDAQVTHLLDIVGNSLDLNLLPDGNYSVWVRELSNVDGQIVKSAWSERVNFEVSTLDNLVDIFQDGVNDLLDLLDGI